MTALTLTNLRLIDPESGEERRGGLTMEDGVISALHEGIGKGIDGHGLCLAPGIVDIGVKVCEPGERHKESFGSAGQAAAAGGVTTIVTRPDTDPAIDSPETLEFVARRAREVPDLNLILVVPTEPERIIFGRDNGMDARHAQALQIRCLALLRRAFGDRMTVVSPAQPRPAPDGTPMPVAGAGIIYLHSKVTLVDDRIGIVGSANLNGRSLLWDTEAALEIRDPDGIRALRLRLSSKWLADAPGDPALARTWTDAATAAAALPPEERKTKVLPYPEERNRRFARYLPILPAAMF